MILSCFDCVHCNSPNRSQPTGEQRVLTAREFQGLADVPPEAEWFANIDNRQTRRAYQNDIKDFMAFVGIARPDEFRIVTRAHVIAWRKSLEARGTVVASDDSAQARRALFPL